VVAIFVNRRSDKFEVEVTPPDGDWRSTDPMSATDVLAQLSAMGCHSTAATDALDASGADWRPAHDAEVLRKRRTNS
jgi:hypothetical protein